MEEEEKRTVSVEMQVDRLSNRVIGTVSNKEVIRSEEQLDTVSGIINRVQDMFNSDGTDWINDYLKHIEEHEYIQAYDLLVKKCIFLKQPISSPILDKLLELDFRKLPREDQYTYLDQIINLGYRGNFYTKIEPLVDIIENDYQEFIDKEMQGWLFLIRSDIYIKTGRPLSANSFLNKVINEPEYSANLRAYAYRQLSWLCPSEKDKLEYIEHAQDLFITTGRKREAMEELLRAHDILISKSPADALNKIDMAIQLLEKESYIDKEISAGLCRKKAYVLYIQKRYNESFKEIEKAIDLQQDLIGNEAEKYATFTFAASLMEHMGNKEKQNEFFMIASSLKSKLQSDRDMNMQFALEEALNLQKGIPDEIKEKILKEGDPEIQFGFFLLSALNQNTPHEEKLRSLDKALQIQEKSIHKYGAESLIYNAIAEVYREHGDIDKAIDWFEKTFSIDPLNNDVLQKYIHLLWSNNLWEQLEGVCKRYIDIAGYFPNVYYTYGESLLNQSKYNEALAAFVKCKNDIPFSIDKEILLCSEHIGESGIVVKPLLQEKKKISINEFINAVREVTDSISQRSRMHLWKYDKNSKSHKWKSDPEEEVKNLFIQGIVQKFNPSDFEILEEVKAGAGRIDLYVLIGSDLRIIIELKMCGGGYSLSYAAHGEDQLVHYLESKNLFLGILIVFDGRTRDFSKGLSPITSIENKTIHTIAVDMRPISS